MSDWISYSGPYYNQNEYYAAIKTLLDGWLVFGPKCREFEKKFSEKMGKKFGVFVNSGSSANLLMMAAAKSENGLAFPVGAKIITPAVCFPTTINPIIQMGFEPVFVDVELPNLNINLDLVEEKLKEDPSIKGLCFAHVAGNPPDMEKIQYLVDKYDIIFFEDTCDALGSYYDSKPLGSFGKMSTCSFYPAHHMTTAEGGYVATDDPKLFRTLNSLRDWGRDCYCNIGKAGCVLDGTACGERFKNWIPELPDLIYDHRYVYREIGYNLKPIEIQGALGLEQMKKLGDMEAARRLNYKSLFNIFEKYKDYFYISEELKLADTCWFCFLVTVKENAPFVKQDLINHLENNRIQTRPYFAGNLLYHPAYKDLKVKYNNICEEFPVSKIATTSSFFLGTFIGIDKEDMKKIGNVVNNFMIMRGGK